MSRQPRNYNQSNYFHIMTQGINRNYIFKEVDEAKKYIKFMYALKDEHNINIIVYCIMGNHAHILLKVDDIVALSNYMKRLNLKYAMYYNYKYSRVGMVFRNRYRSECIYTQNQLINCIKYIYNNPVRAKLCDHPSEYPYTNFKSKYYNNENNNGDTTVFIDVEDDINEVCKDIIAEFLKENNLSLNELKNNRKELKILIELLRKKYKITWKEMEKLLEIKVVTLKNIRKRN